MSGKTSTTRGSCLCGKIKYELVGAPVNNCLCFCNSCRKHTGSVGMANSWYMKENFKLLGGADALRIHYDRSCDSGGEIERGFCADCGSTMVAENKEKFPGAVIVPSGTMEIDPTSDAWAPNEEYFCKRKAPWFTTPEGTVKHRELFS